MEDPENATADVIQMPQPKQPPRWTSEADRDAFLAEHARRTEAGEPLEGLNIPITAQAEGEDQ